MTVFHNTSRRARLKARLFQCASRTGLAAAVAVGAFGALTPPALAAEPEAERIVVTARYREEDLQETPIALTAVTAAQLEARNFTNITDVAQIVPNASFRQAQAAYGRSTTAYIRGIGQYDFNIAFEPGVAFYLDGVYHPLLIGSVFDLFDLERVEVLRGPQGTLFGRGAVGGAVNLIAAQPSGSGEGYVEGTYGSYNRLDLRAGYDMAIIPDRLFARFSGVSKSRDGYQKVLDFVCAMEAAGTPELAGTLPGASLNQLNDGCQVGTAGGEDYQGARVSLKYLATDRLDITFNADYTDDQSEVQANYLMAVNPDASVGWNDDVEAAFGVRLDERFLTGDPYATYATWKDPQGDPFPGVVDFDPVSTTESYGFSAITNYAVTPDINAKLILATRNFESYFTNDDDASPLGYQTVDGRVKHDQFTAELQLTGTSFEESLDWTVGGFYYDATSEAAQIVDLSFFGLFLDALSVNYPTHKAAFANVVYHIDDRLSVNGGVRYSEDEKFFEFDNTLVQADQDISDDSLDWRVGVDYQLNNDVLLYGSVATGYKPPSFNPRPFQPSQFVGVDGEELTAYELGVKGDFFDNMLRLNIAAFYSDYSQRIVPEGGTEDLLDGNGDPIPDPDNPGEFQQISRTFYVNTPATVQGIEAEFELRPVDNLMFTGSFGYAESEAEDDVLFVYVPEFTGSLGVQYDLEVPGLNGMISPRLDYFYTDDILYNTASEISEPGYGLANARITYDAFDSDWTLAFSVTNLTDEFYNQNIFDLIPFGQATTEAQPGRPREVAITATKRF